MRTLVAAVTVQLLLFAMAVQSAHTPPPVESGILIGQVVDATDREPISKVYIIIDQNGAWEPTDKSGHFHFERALPVGTYSLKTYRIGYRETGYEFHIHAGDTTFLQIPLQSQAIEFDEISIKAHAHYGETDMQEPELVVSGSTLQKQLGTTIAKTLQDEPGIAQRSMGPAPARPVLRGMSGNRLKVLEDGEQTGDLSASSSDHAVAIEPMTTEYIEVIRGPESLYYGSSTLGGVVNVVRGYIPQLLPHQVQGGASMQVESVNTGYSGGVNVTAPIGRFAVRLDGSYRHADDVNTPIGPLRNTSIQTQNGSAGLSYIHQNGYIGLAVGHYDSQYGIPPDPLGGHPGGVDIDMNKQNLQLRADWISPFDFFNSVQVHATWSRYYHAEIEKDESIGMEFGVDSKIAALDFILNSGEKFQNGKIGLWYENRSFDTGGLTFMPAVTENKLGVFYYQELVFSRLRLNGSLRYDLNAITPENERISRAVGAIRQRQFDDFSAGVGFDYGLLPGLKTGAAVLRTFRAPTVSELFSEGPHLAAYSYEIGNADLEQENGIGAEFFIEQRTANSQIRATFFRNSLSNYLFPQNTGETSLRRADLFVYQFMGLDAVMQGMEFTVDYDILSSLAATASASYVRGDLAEKPLPMMPPLQGKVDITWKREKYNAGITMHGAAAQDRLGEFEQKTDAFVVTDIQAQYYFSMWDALHVLTVSVENVFDTEYKRHLNRVKEIMPEPGRNFKVLYKMFF